MDGAIATLITAAAADGMVLRRVVMPTSEVVFFKSVLEAYPGFGAVMAEPRASARDNPDTPPPGTSELTVIGARGFERELDDLLRELLGERGAVLEEGGQR